MTHHLPSDAYWFGPFSLDCRTRELWRGDVAVSLAPKAFDLLRALVAASDRVMEKHELMRLVWPDNFVSEDSLTQHIAGLRRALGDVADRPRYILTVPRHGYRFIAAVRTAPSAPALAASSAQLPLVLNTAERVGSRWGSRDFLVLAAIMVAAATGIYVRDTASHARTPVRFLVNPPEGTTFSRSASFLAVSPDGRYLAFLAFRPGQESRLWIRPLGSLIPRELIGTDGALGPFWSPDSRFLAFFAKGSLKKIALLGEPPEVLCPALSVDAVSGTWHSGGVVLFSQPSGIYRTSSSGGGATPVTSVDVKRGELAHVLPQFLPDGRHFVYTARVDAEGSFESWIVLRSIDSADDRRLFAARSQVLLVDGDDLLYVRDGGLLAQPFDAARLQLRGDPRTVSDVEHVGVNPASPRGMFSASKTGVLAYRASIPSELSWFDRAGSARGSLAAAGVDRDLALSHNGLRLAVSRYDPTAASRDIWILDLLRGEAASRLTSRLVWDSCPVWSPDDSSIVFSRGAPNHAVLYEKSATAAEERVLPHLPAGCAQEWTRDGRLLYWSPGTSGSSRGLWLLQLSGGGAPEPLSGNWLAGPGGPQARISPNGRWLAFVGDLTGRREIYVRSLSGGDSPSWQVSSHGGIEPHWRSDGRELFFLGADKILMAVPVSTEGRFHADTPSALFVTQMDPGGLPIVGGSQFAVTLDGQRFLINQLRRDAAPPVTVVLNWREALKK